MCVCVCVDKEAGRQCSCGGPVAGLGVSPGGHARRGAGRAAGVAHLVTVTGNSDKLLQTLVCNGALRDIPWLICTTGPSSLPMLQTKSVNTILKY